MTLANTNGANRIAESNGHEITPSPGITAMQTRGAFSTAVQVLKERTLKDVARRLDEEAALAGAEFYYGWGAGQNHIEGPSVKLAMAAVRCYGNSCVEMLPLQDLPDAWIFTAAFVDLETGFTLTRQFRMSKRFVVYGKHDEARKEDIRFQIGQSKAIRNVALNALPSSLVRRAMEKAKSGVMQELETLIGRHGKAKIIDRILSALQKHGVTEEQVLSKCEVAAKTALTIENIVTLKGDLFAIDEGQEYASELFPGSATDDPPKAEDDGRTRSEHVADQLSGKPAEKKRDKPEHKPETTTAEEPVTSGDGEMFAHDIAVEIIGENADVGEDSANAIFENWCQVNRVEPLGDMTIDDPKWEEIEVSIKKVKKWGLYKPTE